MDNDFARKVSAYIAEHGITQQKVADVLGICWNAVHYKLTGEKPFTLQEAIKLADWMDCSLDWLTGRKPE
jgi:plasmid maintenance system antidote protein VapI